jgi:hypothetical protein
MRFELEPYNRNASPAEIRDDIRRVADALHKRAITAAEYRQHGRFSPTTARRRFGSWFNALAVAGLEETRVMAVSQVDCINDLKAVARRIGKRAVTQSEYVEHGTYSVAPFLRHFGTWFVALETAGLERTRTLGVSNEEYFRNLEEMWIALGRQPHHAEIQKPFSRYCAGAYEQRFGSWRKALEAFVDYVDNGPEEAAVNLTIPLPPNDAPPSTRARFTARHKTSRAISWRLRFVVMRRDDFKCRACGRTPALQPGLVLHVDHIHPWSKGGETRMDNLQTLCEQCNIGKNDLEMCEAHLGG